MALVWEGPSTDRAPGPFGSYLPPAQQLGEQCAQEKECQAGVMSQGPSLDSQPPALLTQSPITSVCLVSAEGKSLTRSILTSCGVDGSVSRSGQDALALSAPLGQHTMAFPQNADSGGPVTSEGGTGEWGCGRLTFTGTFQITHRFVSVCTGN